MFDWQKTMPKAMEGDTNPSITIIPRVITIAIQEKEPFLEGENTTALQRNSNESAATQEQTCRI